MPWKVTVDYELANGWATITFEMRLLSQLVEKLEAQVHDYPKRIVIEPVDKGK